MLFFLLSDKETLLSLTVKEDTLYLLTKWKYNYTWYNKLYALDSKSEVTTLITEGLSNLRGSPIINHNGDIYLFNFGYSLNRRVKIFGYDKKGTPLGNKPLWSESLIGMLYSLAVNINNNLYGVFDGTVLKSFNQEGEERWSKYLLPFPRKNTVSIDKEGAIYFGKERFLYKIIQ